MIVVVCVALQVRALSPPADVPILFLFLFCRYVYIDNVLTQSVEVVKLSSAFTPAAFEHEVESQVKVLERGSRLEVWLQFLECS